MSHGTSSRRQRGRGNGGGRRHNNGGGGGPKRSQVYDSNGPDVRIRGTAHQVCEKYLTLSKDSSSAGDIVLAESYLQHAEHYQRIINSWNEENKDNNRQNRSVRSDDKNEAKADGNTAKSKDDLALPSSILGEKPKAEPVKDVQAESSELSEA